MHIQDLGTHAAAFPWRQRMPKRNVSLDEAVVEAYEVDFNSINEPVTDQDFIGLAKDT